MTLDLRLLVAFIAVAETENVGQAASRLHISQSPLSRQIIQLEAQLGLRLFERTRQRMQLTGEGRLFLSEARGLVAHAAEVAQAARSIARGETGHIAVGYVEGALHSNVLPRALADLQAAHQSATFDIRPMSSAQQVEALLNKAIDFGLVYAAPDRADIDCAEVSNEALLLVLGKHHPLATRAEIAPRDLNGQRWVSLAQSRNPAARRRFLENCAACGFSPDIRTEANDLLAVLRLVAAGLGITVVQASLRDLLADSVVCREIPWYPVRISVYAIWRKGDAKPLVGFLSKLLASCDSPVQR
ncbi:LysR family transcriptional regulator [Pseudomonas gingeri]|uniref:LysR family transcriptional regulator n=1 Tax=Pseudomonas gingeri TaxID=117681 RepID=A0A7Y8CLX4_9PSED|nr:LysR family transcriptional regulator [Pseudomonas gingeri]NVZ99242.1 LysR family transcriptional regulator [Pseudomonas gingeri]NWA13287.1 LysR family transcriptional regulator [Pseudomonas gingeri]NWA55548.1 LysR family transcriptional regulator [Pseudomonas gingeri]NWA95598.1 LysR family transcriptional regulator [Pseudomonas gingeri]NWB00685.1 LysR family transcriptional regulator [Pseudomonas gingeri]